MSDMERTVHHRNTAPLIQSLIEGKELSRWQEHFCDIANVFICCVDGKGNPITEFGGNSKDRDRIKRVIDKEQLQSMLLRVSESTLEDQAIETTAYPNLRLAVISARMDGKPLINWLICGVLSDVTDTQDYEKEPLSGFEGTISEKQFAEVVDALHEITDALIHYKGAMLSARAESRKSRDSELEMGENLKRAEALTEVVQLLENEESSKAVMNRLLSIVGNYLLISTGAVCEISKDAKTLKLIAGWSRTGSAAEAETGREYDCPSFFQTEKTLVLSGNAMIGEEERRELNSLELKSVIIVPIRSSDEISRYVYFGEKVKERVWELDEIKFVNDSVKILQSILNRNKQKSSLADSYASLDTILNHIGAAVYVRSTITGESLFANKSMCTDFEKELADGSLNELLDKNIHKENGISEIYHVGQERWYDLYYTNIRWIDGSLALLCALYDITEKKGYQKKAEQQEYTDFLTGLYNRICCERDLEKYVEEAEKEKSRGELLYLDLDDFKHINDGLGHQYGDVLLKAISNSLKRIEGIENTCYRVGGDEFVIIIPPGQMDRREKIIAAIREIFMKPWFLKDSDYYCTMSMGVVDYPDNGDSVHDLIKKADIAMYEAKKRGKSRVAKYSDSMGTKSGKRLDMEKNMRDATARGYQEFEVFYQPIIDVKHKNLPCTGAEALIRWNNAELGFIPPSEFIPLAEYLGLINPIGNYVLREACRHCKSWNDNGHPDYKVNVNLSVVQLLQSDIVEIIEQTVKDSGLNPQNLTLEVTESLAINDMERMKEILDNIKKLGVRIALDDFGTGYSSLNHIREIPFDVIKVDQSFVRDLERDAYAKSFIKMVGDLAEAIGVNLCIEGVETRNQYEILSEMNIGLIQGYYFDRPMPREVFESKYVPELGREIISII
ncbi:MAG: bifunctional diguanylate cyclase/phosphodiesterase [Lachnospiraceae bacterium]|nr:bifunctional diguanylate cyclase/phosphodiesterase [Lachnospiraceae bacterium]